MGDHFVLLVDRLLTESSLEATIESVSKLQQATPSVCKEYMAESPSYMMDLGMVSSPRELLQCRICHDEDEDTNMEVPCSCCGSLKQFKPGYTAPPPPPPPPLFYYGGIPMDFRGNWEFSRRDLHNSQFIAMVTTDHEFLDSDIDEYSAISSSGLICCRVIAIIFMVLLVLRHTLPIIITGAGEYSLTLFTLLMLRTIGILLPIFVMVKAFTAVQRRHRRQDPHFSLGLDEASDEENDLSQFQSQSRFIQIR
ncbi:uncharacterized protein LOC120012331 isoform X2 [Tripterygium wilfordii]|uniref:uncharacterized protein LOC120012331 isoform X2 n=1 Tax=Tripterygium wilfordii TaxID=458696 RepID=UPI0018F854DE|nr:uncharacterized protein LOC120012331 isoform X2 [Tripterygium wilfordii]